MLPESRILLYGEKYSNVLNYFVEENKKNDPGSMNKLMFCLK